MFKSFALFVCAIAVAFFSVAQPKTSPRILPPSGITRDTLLKPIVFFDYSKKATTEFLPEWKDGVVYAGKSTYEVTVKNLQVDATGNAARQWMSKVPGMTVWESDGSGLNTSIATRGWSPNRSWDLNVRMDGMDIASDPMGYPEAYYAPPTEFISGIQLIKGAGALAYGTQFGGFLNYNTVEPVQKKMGYQGSYSIGSFNTQSMFHGISGTKNKWKYGIWLHQREGDGFRQNSTYKTQNALVKLGRNLSNGFAVDFLYNKHFSTAQQSGGLTDAQWQLDDRYSSRARNWFNLDWQVAGLSLTQKKENHFWSNKLSYMCGERNSIGFVNSIDVTDNFDPINGFPNRQLDIDLYNNWSFESRYTHFVHDQITFNGGVRGFMGTTDRRQKGTGYNGSDANFNLIDGGTFERDIDFTSTNAAVFSELIIKLGKLTVIPGARYEYMENTIEGKYSASYGVSLQQKNRNVLLYGAAIEYHLDENNEVVLNYNKSFRPALFSELTPSATTDVINPDLKDAQGYNLDAFIRGKVMRSRLHYQLGGYYTLYADKIGNYTENGIRYVTNIGDALSKGVEALLDYRLGLPNKPWSLNVWAALSVMDVKYTSWNDPSIADVSKNRSGNFVEYAPSYIHRAGINGSYKKASIQMTSNWVSSLYTDALNTINSDAKATSGKLPAYQLIDVSLKYNFNKFVQAQINVNNLLDEKYATRRAGGYPGPGLLPGNPRNLTFTLFFNI